MIDPGTPSQSCVSAFADTDCSIGVSRSGQSIGINPPGYAQLVQIPLYPACYKPHSGMNLLFHDALRWVRQRGDVSGGIRLGREGWPRANESGPCNTGKPDFFRAMCGNVRTASARHVKLLFQDDVHLALGRISPKSSKGKMAR